MGNKIHLLFSIVILIAGINGDILTQRLLLTNPSQSQLSCSMFEGGLNNILSELEDVRSNTNQNPDIQLDVNDNYNNQDQCSQLLISKKIDLLKSKYLVLTGSRLSKSCSSELRREFETESEQLITQIENVKSQINDEIRSKVGSIQSVLGDLQDDVNQKFKPNRHSKNDRNRQYDDNDGNFGRYNGNSRDGDFDSNGGNRRNNFENYNGNVRDGDFDRNNGLTRDSFERDGGFNRNNGNRRNNFENYNGNGRDGGFDRNNENRRDNTASTDCVDEVEEDRFSTGCQELMRSNDESEIQYVVKTVLNRNSSYIENILNFAERMEKFEQTSFIYKILMSEMQLKSLIYDPKIMMIGYRIHTIIHASNFSSLSPEVKQNILLVNEMLPGLVKDFPWNGEIRFMNMEFNEYFYAAVNSYAYDNERRSIFTYIGSNTTTDDQFYWKLETESNGKFIFMKNKQFNEYLFAGSDQRVFDPQRRNVFTWRHSDDLNSIREQGSWQFEPVQGHDYFKIKNDYFDEYLYAGEDIKFDDYRRRCMTWRPKGCEGKHCFWRIEKMG